MKAIETKYAGYRFRSRLEARWAVVFDNLNLRWRYEDEGFEFPDGSWYLPDFWLETIGCFVEVKGAEIAPYDENRIAWLTILSGKPVYLARDIPNPSGAFTEGMRLYFADSVDGAEDFANTDEPYFLCRCDACERFDIGFEGRSSCRCDGAEKRRRDPYRPELLIAYAAGRGARFEHGESPVVVSPMDLPPRLRTVTPEEWQRILEIFGYYMGQKKKTGS